MANLLPGTNTKRPRKKCAVCAKRRLVNYYVRVGSTMHVGLSPLGVTSNSVVIPQFLGWVCWPCVKNGYSAHPRRGEER